MGGGLHTHVASWAEPQESNGVARSVWVQVDCFGISEGKGFKMGRTGRMEISYKAPAQYMEEKMRV